MFPFLCPTIAEIDQDSLAYNYHQIRSRVYSEAKILAVVKDNGYGHGAVVIARELDRLGIDLLGIAITDEGVELRDGGIKKPILIIWVYMRCGKPVEAEVHVRREMEAQDH